VRRSWAAVTVGALVLAVVALGAIIFRYITEGVGKGKGMVVWALFHDAKGIYEKSRVLSAGLEVGQIEKRELDPSGLARITVRVLPEKIKLYKNAVVAKRAASLLGEFYLDLDPGTPREIPKLPPGSPPGTPEPAPVTVPPLQNGDQIIHVIEPVEMGQIIEQVGATLPILRDILKDVRELTSGQVKQIADNVNDMIAKNSVTLDRLLQRVDHIAANVDDITTSEAQDLKAALRNVKDITEGVKQLVGTSQGEVSQTGAKLRSSVDKLQASIDSLEHSMKNVEHITDAVADKDKGTIGHLVNDPTIANNIEQITDDAGTFVKGLSRLQTIVGLRTEYNYLASTYKSYFTIQIAPRPDKFYLVELVDDPRGFREQSTEIHDNSRLGTYSDTVVKTSQKLRVTFQLGKCIGIVCGRFGIKESTGGAGVDVHLLDDWLTLSADVFDTQSNAYPRFQGRAYVNVYKRYVQLIGGVDDVFNYVPSKGGAGGFFDWFFGAQLRFNDEDLKALLLFGGSSLSSAATSK
jgi:phospholipid/cholesterol/gamma-HCH transport system substrate-binding protein